MSGWFSLYNCLDNLTEPNWYTRGGTSYYVNVRRSQVGPRDESCYGKTCCNESKQFSYQHELCVPYVYCCWATAVPDVRTVGLQTKKTCNSKTWNIQSKYLINAAAILGFGESFNVRWLPHSQFVDENDSTISFKFSQGLVASHPRRNRRFIPDTSKAFFSSPQPLLSGSGFHSARKKWPANETEITLV